MTARDEIEANKPTDERLLKDRIYEGENGCSVIEFPTYKDVMADMGYLDDDQLRALDDYSLWRYIGLRHLDYKTPRVGELAREIGVDVEDIPSMRDGYRHCSRHLSFADQKTLNLIIMDVAVTDNILAIRYAMTALVGEVDRAATNLVKAMKVFHDERKELQRSREACCI